MKVRILHKGLALVIIPFVIESCFFLQLYALNEKTETFAKEEEHQRELVGHFNNIIVLFAATYGQLFTYMQTSDSARVSDAKLYEQKLQNEFAEATRLAGDDPRHKRNMDYVRTLINRHIKLLETTRPITDREGFLLWMQANGSDIRQTLKDISRSSNEGFRFSSEEQERLTQMRKDETAARESFKRLITWGMTANLLGALLLVALFVSNITRRLNLLVENARRLPAGEPLKEIPGTDELSYLDSALHQAAESLKIANERRKHLIQMVAHDLRSPLMASQIAVDVLKNKAGQELNDMGKRQVDSLKRNMDRMVRLTDDLLTIEKLEAGTLEFHPEIVELRDFVSTVLDSLAELAHKKTIRLFNECSPISVRADRHRLEQVLANLVTNAIKYSPNATNIEVKSQLRADSVQVSVIDQGPGLSKKDQARIFEKFYQANNGTGTGFGLGLSIVKLLVEAQGGNLGVESVQGKGSRFWFTIKGGQAQSQNVTDLGDSLEKTGDLPRPLADIVDDA
jgi:signal transduction histidine kinase